MNLRFVEAFYWVATLRSVSRAAERLFITQSAMSSRIAALEEELGTLLLDRRDKSFRLTVAGNRFLIHAQKLLDMQRIAKSELSGSLDGSASVLRVGAIESVMHSWLVDWLSAIRKVHVGLSIELTVETTPLLLDHVRRGVLDLAFSAAPISGDTLRSTTLPPMEMVLLGSKPLQRRRTYSRAEICAFDIMTFQRGSQPHVALIDMLRDEADAGARIHAISSISAMVELAETGFGVATIPKTAANKFCKTRDVCVLKTDFTLQPLTIFANYRLGETVIDTTQAVGLASEFALRTDNARDAISKNSMTR